MARRALRRMVRRPGFWLGGLVGAALMWVALELPYLNWRWAVPPVEERPVSIRRDGRGGGEYQAPRSGNRRHRGVDLTAALGSPIRAVRSGTVIQVGTHRGLGRLVELEHGSGLTSLYAHLSAVHVRVGQRVRQGEVIGTVGKTGNARHPAIMPHVHVEMAYRGERIDPTPYVLDRQTAAHQEQDVDDAGGD